MKRLRTPPRSMLRLNAAVHVWLYRRSGGRVGAVRNGLPVLLLTTTGRVSGKSHTIPVAYLTDGTNYVIMPGVYERPDWYRNLNAHSHAMIQICRERFAVTAVQAAGEDRDRLWQMTPHYWRVYQAQYIDLLPMMILQPEASYIS